MKMIAMHLIEYALFIFTDRIVGFVIHLIDNVVQSENGTNEYEQRDS